MSLRGALSQHVLSVAMLSILAVGCSPRMERTGQRVGPGDGSVQSSFQLKTENESHANESTGTSKESGSQSESTASDSTAAPAQEISVDNSSPEMPSSVATDQNGHQAASASASGEPTVSGSQKLPGTWDSIKTQASEAWQDVSGASVGMWEVVTSGDFWLSLPGRWWEGASSAASWAFVSKPSDFLMWASTKWKDHGRGPHFKANLQMVTVSTESEQEQKFDFFAGDTGVNGTCYRVSKNGKHFILAMIGRKSSTGRHFNRGTETFVNDRNASLVLQFEHKISSKPKDQRFGIVDFRYKTLEEGKDVKMPDPLHRIGVSTQTMVYVDHDIDINREQLNVQELNAEGVSLDGRYLFKLKGQLSCKFNNQVVEL